MSLRHAFGDRGSLNLELALATPVLLMLTVGSLFLGLLYVNKAGLESSAMLGARTAAYYGGDFDEVEQDIADEARLRFMGDSSAIQVTIAFTDSDGSPYTHSYALGSAGSAPGISAAAGSRITVKVTYTDYLLSIPFVTDSQGELSGTAVSRNAAP